MHENMLSNPAMRWWCSWICFLALLPLYSNAGHTPQRPIAIPTDHPVIPVQPPIPIYPPLPTYPPFPTHPPDNYCPSRDNQNFTFGEKTYALHCDQSIWPVPAPGLQHKNLRACGEACSSDETCVAAFKDTDGYCQRLQRFDSEGEAAWAPLGVERVVTVTTGVATSTITQISTMTATIISTTTSTATATSPDSRAERETKTLYLDTNGRPTAVPFTPQFGLCDATEAWTVRGRRFVLYRDCRLPEFIGTSITPEGGAHSIEDCMEAVANDNSGFIGVQYYPQTGSCTAFRLQVANTWRAPTSLALLVGTLNNL